MSIRNEFLSIENGFLVKNSMKECNSSVVKKPPFVIKIKKNLLKNKLEFVIEKSI